MATFIDHDTGATLEATSMMQAARSFYGDGIRPSHVHPCTEPDGRTMYCCGVYRADERGDERHVGTVLWSRKEAV